MTAQKAITMGVETKVLRSQNGKLLSISFMHHPGVYGVKAIMENSMKGNGGVTVVDGMIIFSCDNKHVPVVSEHKALTELYAHILSHKVYLSPFSDGFREGIVFSIV
jgi:hypothetical protein